MEKIEFQCIPVEQPIGTFYIGSINCRDLLYISYADIRRMDKREVLSYLGIQRPLSNSRVKEIKAYVHNVDATFPTSIIMQVSSKDASFDKSNKLMSITKARNVAKILDGQHRIKGLEEYQKNNFELNVTIFIDMDIEDQATVFSTINLKQTKVNKSLAYDLFDLAKSRSPQKTCHNIARLLNIEDGSPFKDKIKILGVASGNPNETLTQASFIDQILSRYISKNPMKDRNLLKRGKKLKRAEGLEIYKLIFRNMFIDDQDEKIAKILWNYFKAVELHWEYAWSHAKPGLILNRTTGFIALMRFLRPCYLALIETPGPVPSSDNFLNIISKISIPAKKFKPENYKPGSSGAALLYREFLELSGLENR